MSLQVWLPLTGHLNNQGLSNVTVTNNGATVDNNGKIGKCYSFNGSSAKITNTLPATVSSSIGTLACWVKFNAFPQSASGSGVRWYSLIQLGALGGFATCRLGLYMEYTNVINISIDGSDTGKNVYTHSLSTNTWYHLCATYDGTLVKLYINGSQVMSKTATKGTYTTAASYLYCGATNSYWTNGYMNDIRYYDHALSAKEVKELSKGLVLHYPLSAGFGGAENLFRDSVMGQHAIDNFVSNGSEDWTKYFRFYNGTAANHSFADGIDTITLKSGANIGIAFQRKATDIALDSSSYYTISCEAKCEVSGAHLDIGLSFYTTANAWDWRGGTNAKNFTAVDTWQKFTHTFKPDSNTQYIMYCFTVNSTTGKHFSIRHCKLEKGSVATPWTMNMLDTEMADLVTTEYDVSGYNNHGTENGTLTYSSDSARYAVCSNFNGTNTYIEADPLPAETKTISVWLKTSWAVPPSGYRVAMHDKNTGLAIGWTSNNALITKAGTTNGSAGSTTGKYIANQWNHVVVVKTGDNTRDVYINGEPITTSVNNYWGADLNKLDIGTRHYNGSYSAYWDGQISDFRAYATALTAEDIKELYNTAASLANNGTLFAYDFVEV